MASPSIFRTDSASQVNRPSPVPFPLKEEQITQAQLIRVMSLRNMISALKADLDSVEAQVKTALESGATVDPGVHIAALKESPSKTVSLVVS